MRHLPPPGRHALVGPLGRAPEGLVGNLRFYGMADEPGDHARVGQVADAPDGGDGRPIPGHALGDLALNLQPQDHPPAFLGRQQPEVEIWIVGRRVAELRPGVVAPLLEPSGPLIGPPQRRFAEPFGDVVAHRSV